MPSSNTLPKTVRLRKSSEFLRVYAAKRSAAGFSAADGVLIVLAFPNELDRCRLGLSVSKKVGNAPVRNRWKRLIREAFRKHRGEWGRPFDIVVIPQKHFSRGTKPPAAAEVEKSLTRLVGKIVKKIEN